ncbi:hypothetical protein DesLBE_3961 [Desulfitobacterium sp. LBE]|uniref:Uncharacterized protein n=1 Tax=bioreactor metagenome TaxID=1076179 RepID=A0A644W8W0_9ZZZZ|nr:MULTISPECIES: DUF6103 family protein [Desulfitobacterium]MEA5026015.1 DUF6103 family protein [Desulfitobacterium hafniense]TWH59573.1 hypothetical protein DesLBE_3961 [Desulfitobacterium sp. LBE]
MKVSSILIQYDKEKLEAIRRCLKDEAELQTELTGRLQTLYEKHVPEEVRQGIENREG